MKKMTQEEFIARACAVHGNKYDYSKVIYKNSKTKVIITCPKHGDFEQMPGKHLYGEGCLLCSREYQADDLSRKADYARRSEKRKKTMMMKYGVDNPMKLDSVKAKIKSTCMDRYGVENPRQLEAVVDKARQTNLERYGAASYLQSEQGLARMQQTMREHYGTDNFMKSEEHLKVVPEMVRKAKETSLKRYGAVHYSKSDDALLHRLERKEKENETKRINGTFNTSQPEQELEHYLKMCFGEDDVLTQYMSDEYPYMCDFYIKSRDMYIELNAIWSHGYHWFDDSNSDDMMVVAAWQSKHNAYYDNSIQTWTVRDVEKRNTAKSNQLNYIVFWNADLLDFYVWLSLDCPDGHDYDEMYSWLPKRCELRLNKPHYKKLSNGNISQLAKYYQQDVFYAREKAMWHDNFYFRNMPLRMYLYANRQKYLGKSPLELSDAELLRGFGISGILRNYTAFDTSVMQDVIKTYNIKSVIDPCAGWGERMLCCYANDIKYQGFDINMLLCEGYDNMIDDFEMCNQTISFGDSSIANISGHYDAVITCPPYYNTEIYSKTGAENLSYADFLSWWNKVVQNFSNVTYFCFQINQKYKNDMSNIVLQNGFQLIDIISQNTKTSHFNRKNGVVSKHEYEEMLIFKK